MSYMTSMTSYFPYKSNEQKTSSNAVIGRGRLILVCYIRKYVIILVGIFPLTSPPTKILEGMCPRHPRRGWRQWYKKTNARFDYDCTYWLWNRNTALCTILGLCKARYCDCIYVVRPSVCNVGGSGSKSGKVETNCTDN